MPDASLQRIASSLLVIGIEVALIVAVCGILYAGASLILSRVVAPRSPSLAEWSAAARMALAIFACGWFGLPSVVRDMLVVGLRVYLVVAIGIMVVRCTTVTVDTLDGLSQRAAHRRGWVEYYDRLHPLLPTFRACLEYALWIGVISLVLLQVQSFRHLAVWGPRLAQAIGFFFAGRVLVELGALEIGRRMLPREGLADTDRRRRETMVPLVRTAFTYATYFGTAVLILGSLGFNPMPFLAEPGARPGGDPVRFPRWELSRPG
jgi:hypothetical protein